MSLMGWQGPFKVVTKVGAANYIIRIPGNGKRLYHVNLVTKLRDWEADAMFAFDMDIDWDEEGIARSAEIQAQTEEGIAGIGGFSGCVL